MKTSPSCPKKCRAIFRAGAELDGEIGDVATELDETDMDRVILDLPEPWHVIERAWHALGRAAFCSVFTNGFQVKTLVDALRDDKRLLASRPRKP